MFWNIFRDLNLMSRHQFLFPVMLIIVMTMFSLPFNKFYVTTSIPCRDLAILFSTALYVATSFLLSATDPWSQLPFSCCDLKLSVFSLSCRNLIVSFFAEIYVANSIMPLLSQPHFLVTTFLTVQLILIITT